MTNKTLAVEIRTIIEYLLDESGKQDRYALQCCDELDKKMNILDMFQNSLIVEHHIDRAPIEFKQREDGGIETIFNSVVEFSKNKMNQEGKKALTEWVIENIDKEIIRKWLGE